VKESGTGLQHGEDPWVRYSEGEEKNRDVWEADPGGRS